LRKIQNLTVQFPLGESDPSAAAKVSSNINEITRHLMEQMLEEFLPILNSLQNISMLSVGNGSQTPAFWLRDFDLSTSQLGLMPTNPFSGHFLPPSVSSMLDGLSGDVEQTSKRVLGERFHRLNAPLLPTPMLLATALCRFPAWRQVFVQQIEALTRNGLSRQHVANAVTFLKSYDWTGEWRPEASEPSLKELEIIEGLNVLLSLRRYQERGWAIGMDGDTLKADTFFKYFRERNLDFHSWFSQRLGSVGDPSAYDKNIEALYGYLQKKLADELDACEAVRNKLGGKYQSGEFVGVDWSRGPDEIAEFFVLRNLELNVAHTTDELAQKENLEELDGYARRLNGYLKELERHVPQGQEGPPASPPSR
jgi:hypothetical protein